MRRKELKARKRPRRRTGRTSPRVAMKPRGDKIGIITNLIAGCMAVGAFEPAYRLVDELQNALDNLKHDTQVDHDVIRNIREMVPPAAWRSAKQARQIPKWSPECRCLNGIGSDSFITTFALRARSYFRNGGGENRKPARLVSGPVLSLNGLRSDECFRLHRLPGFPSGSFWIFSVRK